MNLYVNMYLLPENKRSSSPDADNLMIGKLCRSIHEARNEAITFQVLPKEDCRAQYAGTINDPLATKTIQEWLPLAESTLRNLIDMGKAWPKDVNTFFEYWDASVNTVVKAS